ncbi:hypothetical protein F5Y11DRAFT_353100 [Daldinia sp. FL1419]|nr:hypothetical protein F5Y11DRAFT_353100 [Daldinia sp. FL1419]
MEVKRLRPVNWDKPRDSSNTEAVVTSLTSHAPEFDDTWYRALKQSLDHSDIPISSQKDLTDVPASADMLPVIGKAYFLPCIAAAAQKNHVGHNILYSLNLLDVYLASKPKGWESGARFLVTDFVSPDKAHLKLYLRRHDSSFDAIWDYFTLEGRIYSLDDVKGWFRESIKVLGDVEGETGHQTRKPPTEGWETDIN